MLTRDPPPGVVLIGHTEEDIPVLTVKLVGPNDTPYAGGNFLVEAKLGHRYPFEAPQVRFVTRVYHPNVDEAGRICLDSLKLPPAGSWRPSLNLAQVFSQLVILFAEPGLSDPLMKDIAELYKSDREHFNKIAREWTAQYAQTDASSTKTKKQRLEEDGALS